MAKSKSRWVCQECGFQSLGFLGRCTECGAWASLVEEISQPEPPAGLAAAAGFGSGGAAGQPGARGIVRRPTAIDDDRESGPISLSDIQTSHAKRLKTGISGLDEVLGGGLVPGAVILIAGDPGIGKSTLLLQVARHLSQTSKVLYLAGEESATQVRIRASRLNMEDSTVLVDTQQNVIEIAESMLDFKDAVAIVDSIQSV